MSRWVAHRATFICEADRKTARARRAFAFEGRAPLCPACRRPMALQDQRGLTAEAKLQLDVSRTAQAMGATVMRNAR